MRSLMFRFATASVFACIALIGHATTADAQPRRRVVSSRLAATATYSSLELAIVTGNDDLKGGSANQSGSGSQQTYRRGGSHGNGGHGHNGGQNSHQNGAGSNLDVEVVFGNGTTLPVPNVNQGQRWTRNSTHPVSIPLNQVASGQIMAVRLRTTGNDSWAMSGITIKAVGANVNKVIGSYGARRFNRNDRMLTVNCTDTPIPTDTGMGSDTPPPPPPPPPPANREPTPNAGGPYTITEGGTLVLDAGRSSDPDGDPLKYTWEIGSYDSLVRFADAGARLTLPWSDLQARGITANQTYPVVVRVDDGHGHAVTASTTLTVKLTPTPTPPPQVEPLVTQLVLTFRTGNDNLRGGDDNLNVEVLFKDGTKQAKANVNDSKEWPRYSPRNEVVITLDKPVPVADIIGLQLLTNFKGGFDGENWDMEGVDVRAVGGSLSQRIASYGFNRFEGGPKVVKIPTFGSTTPFFRGRNAVRR